MRTIRKSPRFPITRNYTDYPRRACMSSPTWGINYAWGPPIHARNRRRIKGTASRGVHGRRKVPYPSATRTFPTNYICCLLRRLIILFLPSIESESCSLVSSICISKVLSKGNLFSIFKGSLILWTLTWIVGAFSCEIILRSICNFLKENSSLLFCIVMFYLFCILHSLVKCSLLKRKTIVLIFQLCDLRFYVHLLFGGTDYRSFIREYSGELKTSCRNSFSRS